LNSKHLEIKQVVYIEELSSLQTVRQQVFQIEQGIDPDLEFDEYDPLAIHWLAYWQENPVGTVRIREYEPLTAKIERLAVIKALRGQGIATELMEVALKYARQHNYEKSIQNENFLTLGPAFLRTFLCALFFIWSVL
jgi:predicted GNAT family N-acyltransferase